MPEDSLIGRSSPPRTYAVEQGAIRALARAIGDPNPLYQDEAFARQHGYRNLVAPPTMCVTLEADPIPGLDLPATGMVHGAQEIHHLRPICAGDTVHVVASLLDVTRKRTKLGDVAFVSIETVGSDPQGEPFYRQRMTLIVMGGARDAG